MADAGAGQLDTDVSVNWDGSDDVITATGAGGVVYDAADSLRGKRLKATYTVNPSGEITGVTDQEWSASSGKTAAGRKRRRTSRTSAARVSTMLLAAGEPPVPYLGDRRGSTSIRDA